MGTASHPEPPRALLFDVFGTLVDWRSGVIGALRALGERCGIDHDWAALADAWRAAYAPSMDRVRRGEVAWQNLDALHRTSLDALLAERGLDALPPAERRRAVHAWHELAPWPDVGDGLERLRARFVIASLSNGNVALQVDLRRFAKLPFDMLFSAELFERYKPDPATYLGACRLLAQPPERVMLVAAHADDLRAARACGLQTAFIERPCEFGPPCSPDPPDDGGADYRAAGIDALAAQLGA